MTAEQKTQRSFRRIVRFTESQNEKQKLFAKDILSDTLLSKSID